MKVLRKQRRDASPNVKAETSDHRTPSVCSPCDPFSIVVSPVLFFFFVFLSSSLAGESKLFHVVRHMFAPFLLLRRNIVTQACQIKDAGSTP